MKSTTQAGNIECCKFLWNILQLGEKWIKSPNWFSLSMKETVLASCYKPKQNMFLKAKVTVQ
jgi:hypothetical protein